jgi:hypothetical protein
VGLLAWSLAPGHFAALGVVILWLVSAGRLWSAPRGPTPSELARAVVLAAVPLLSTWLVAFWLGSGSRGSVPGPVLIPAWIATAGSISLGLYLASLARRLGRLPANAPSAAAPVPTTM